MKNTIINTLIKIPMVMMPLMVALILIVPLLLIPITAAYGAQTGVASWYGPGFHGKKTASGQTFNQYKLTAAHKSLRFGKKVKVTNLRNKKSVIVRINDRGPFIKGRTIDLSYAAAKKIGMVNSGTAKVSIKSAK